jgi:hypothetical protein
MRQKLMSQFDRIRRLQVLLQTPVLFHIYLPLCIPLPLIPLAILQMPIQHTFGSVRIATQIGKEWIVCKIFFILFAHTLDDRSRYKCPSFSAHAARGLLLQNCTSIFNISRHHANDAFKRQAFVALIASIEEHMEPWMTESSDEPQGACLLSTLFHRCDDVIK